MTWNTKKVLCLRATLPLLLVWSSTAFARTDFKTEILPILEAKCQKCHQAPREENGKTVKPKADLRLDAAWAMLKGGESKRPSVVPGSSAKSYFYEVVTLPKDDDMFMPPKGEPLTPAEIAKVKAWLDEGADFAGWEGNLVGKPAEAAAVASVPRERDHVKTYEALADGVASPSKEALKQVTASGAQVTPLMPGSPLLRVDFLTGVSKCTDDSIQALLPIKDQIVHLDLARTGITDAALKTLAGFPRLIRLDLRRTKVTDQGLSALATAPKLTYLNLYGTEVTDAGAQSLTVLKSLRQLYLFETKVTAEGAAKLKKALPQAEIVTDLAMPEPPNTGSQAPRRRES